MLRVSDLRKSYSGQVLFEHVSFAVGAGRRIGVVGPNGSGKTTLLRILAGEEEADAGHVDCAGVAWLPQHVATGGENVGDFLAPPGWDRVRELEQRLACGEDLLDAYADSLDRAGGYGWEARAEGALEEVRLRLAFDRDVATLSGGERTRLALARVLMSPASVLLLDEPTNHLDAPSIERLEAWLLDKTAVIVSHDRRLLDRVAHETLALEPLQARARVFAGGYSAWRDAAALEEARAWREYREQQERVRALSQDIRATRDSARGIESRTVNDFARGRAKKVAAKAKARETRLERMLSNEQRKEKPRTLERVRLVLEGSDRHGAVLVRLDHAGVPGILHDVSLTVCGGDRILVRGPNGGGKTTLLRLLLREARPGLSVGYLPQHQETLPDDVAILDWLRQRVVCEESEIRTFLHRFLFTREEVFRPIGVLSQGERMRVILASLMLAAPDLLILDEPGNHLDLPTLERLEEALNAYAGTLIVATHDRTLAERLRPGWAWEVEDGRVARRLA